MTGKPLPFSPPLREDDLFMVANKEERGSHLLKQLLGATGEVEKAIELLVVDHGIPKRIAESLACGLGALPRRYEPNKGTFGAMGQKRLLHAKRYRWHVYQKM